MTQNYTNVDPIYSLFNLNIDLPNYLLNEYKYIIKYNDDTDDTDENNDININNNNINESWEKTFNDALLRLGNYLVNKD